MRQQGVKIYIYSIVMAFICMREKKKLHPANSSISLVFIVLHSPF